MSVAVFARFANVLQYLTDVPIALDRDKVGVIYRPTCPAPYDNSDRAIRCSAASSSSSNRSVSSGGRLLEEGGPVVGDMPLSSRDSSRSGMSRSRASWAAGEMCSTSAPFLRLQGRKYELLLVRCKIFQQVGNVLRLPFGQYLRILPIIRLDELAISGNVSFFKVPTISPPRVALNRRPDSLYTKREGGSVSAYVEYVFIAHH